jgi:hypothetical protein
MTAMTPPTCPAHPRVVLLPKKKKGWYCPECDDVVLTYDEHPREGTPPAAGLSPAAPSASSLDALASSLPMLLALPLRELEHEASPAPALWALCDLVEGALKLVVMAGLGTLTHGGRALPDTLLRQLRDQVELPTLGKWMGMARAVAKHAPREAGVPLAETSQSLERLLGGRDATVETGLLPLRNRLAHGGPVTRAEALRHVTMWRPRVVAWAEESLGWMRDVRLIVVDAMGKRFVLRGEVGEELAADDTGHVPADAPAGSAWLCTSAKAFALGPLGAFDTDKGAPLAYVRSGEVRLQYLRLGDEGGICDSHAEARERFRQLFFSDPVEARATGARRFTVRDFEAEIRQESSRRVGRERELGVLRAAVHALDAGALWVGGPAGIGKSNLMAAVMEDLLAHPPEGALVLPYRFKAGDDRCGRSPFLTYLRERLEASDCLAPLEEASEGKEGGENGKTKSNNAAAAALDPVQEVKDLLGRLLPARRVLLVVDGLDEVAERDARFVDDVLFRLRTERVAIAAAGRSERGLPEAFAKLGAIVPFPRGRPTSTTSTRWTHAARTAPRPSAARPATSRRSRARSWSRGSGRRVSIAFARSSDGDRGRWATVIGVHSLTTGCVARSAPARTTWPATLALPTHESASRPGAPSA